MQTVFVVLKAIVRVLACISPRSETTQDLGKALRTFFDQQTENDDAILYFTGQGQLIF